RPPDGRTQELQPEEQGQEELPADSDVSVRDTRIHQRRTAQWGSTRRRADRTASGKRVRGPAADSADDLCAGRFWILLLGCGTSFPEPGRAVHCVGVHDLSFGGRVESVL